MTNRAERKAPLKITHKLLFALRNNIPLNKLFERHLNVETKYREGFLRFQCHHCSEMNSAVNPRTNLARCFTCGKNFNPIDLVMEIKRCSFQHAVKLLIAWFPTHTRE